MRLEYQVWLALQAVRPALQAMRLALQAMEGPEVALFEGHLLIYSSRAWLFYQVVALH